MSEPDRLDQIRLENRHRPLTDKEIGELVRRLRDASDPHRQMTCAWSAVALEQVLAALDAAQAQLADARAALQVKERLIDEICEEYGDSKDSCDQCEDCSPLIMCSAHSIVSLLRGRTLTNAAIKRLASPSRQGSEPTGVE